MIYASGQKRHHDFDVPSESKRSAVRNASDRWRRKPADALLLQVTADLPNAAEYEADRHRDSDFDNHQQHQSHRYLSSRTNAVGCRAKVTGAFFTWRLW